MKKILLTDESGSWFSPDESTKFEQVSEWNGKSLTSKATGSNTEEETLYYTKLGNWVKIWHSFHPHIPDVVEKIYDHEAFRWLVKQGIDIPGSLKNAETYYEI